MDKIKKIIISAIVIFAFSMMTIFLLLKVFNTSNTKTMDKPKSNVDTLIKNNTTQVDSIKSRTIQMIKESKEIQLKKSLDSLNTLFIEEVSGSGPTKKAGYGQVATKIKLKIDSLKIKLDSLHQLED